MVVVIPAVYPLMVNLPTAVVWVALMPLNVHFGKDVELELDTKMKNLLIFIKNLQVIAIVGKLFDLMVN